MITIEKAQKLLETQICRVREKEVCPLAEALGRVLAEDLSAKTDQPPFPRSPLDGYAVRSRDIRWASKGAPVPLRVTGEVLAGEYFGTSVQAGQAVRIMTGAPIPDGADTVIRQEDTDYGEDTVSIYKALEPYQNYCIQGEDFKSGECLLCKGETLDAARIGIAAGMGYDSVKVHRRLVAAVFTTGSELTEPGQELVPGQIYNANRFLIGARLMELGIRPVLSENLTDSPEQASQIIRKASEEVDLIITTGGVSVGKKDIMHDVAEILKAGKLFWKVQMKPGSPAMAAVLGKACMICLSGNPFGAAVGFELLVRPALFYLTGNRNFLPVRQKKVMAMDYAKAGNVRRFVRAIADHEMVHIPDGLHSPGVLSTMKGCNCLIEIPEGNDGLKKGEQVWVIQLP